MYGVPLSRIAQECGCETRYFRRYYASKMDWYGKYRMRQPLGMGLREGKGAKKRRLNARANENRRRSESFEEVKT